MVRKYFILSLGVILMLALVGGCAKAPQESVDAAKAALETAKQAEADRYMADEFKAAQDSLNAALAEIETQNSKFALTRNYNKAARMLEAATTLANSAAGNVVAKKEAVKTEAQQLLVDLQTALTDAKALLKKAPKGKEGREALEAIKNELTTVENSLTEVPVLIDNGDFLNAKDKLTAGLQKVQQIIGELNQAIAKKLGK
jgi:tetrahydromethanopterin S-methyltransferase subunit G